MTDAQRLIDFHDVEQTLLRYASSIDTEDFDALRALFCDDARVQYGASYPPLVGADAVVEWVAEKQRTRPWSHHLLSVYHVDVSGDEATALTYQTSQMIDAADPGTLLVITARYRDRLRREHGTWKILSKEMDIGSRERRPLV